jgi:3-oxoacyl-[acyl-carrier protein] reductase
MNYSFLNKIAIVTGASKGIGFSIAEQLLLAGAKVYIISRQKEALDNALMRLNESGNKAYGICGDVADPELPKLAINQILLLWGCPPNILINNAGGPPMGSFLDHEEGLWEKTLQTNFLSAVRFAKAVTPGMKENKWGRIISISSTVAKEPSSQMVLSASARAALSAFNKSISLELAPFGITANIINPGGVATDRLVSLVQLQAKKMGISYEEMLKNNSESIPLKRYAEPEEIASAALFLASESASYITGVSLAVDGGLIKNHF